jgi:hypothetical protein
MDYDHAEPSSSSSIGAAKKLTPEEEEANLRLQVKAKAIYEAELAGRRLPEAEEAHMRANKGRHELDDAFQLHDVRITATVQSIQDSYSALAEQVLTIFAMREPAPWKLDVYMITSRDVEKMPGGIHKMLAQLPLKPSEREKGYMEELLDRAFDHVHWDGKVSDCVSRRTGDYTLMQHLPPLVTYMYE